MNDAERLNLQKMITTNNVEDCTETIRTKKHSSKIKDDVQRLINLKQKYPRLSKTNPEQFDSIVVSQCNFLFTNYTDIFNKVKKDEIDMKILMEFLNVLKMIEENKIDQHEGSYQVGKLLKSIYIDSALRKAEKLDKKTGNKTTTVKKDKKITWSEYKATILNKN